MINRKKNSEHNHEQETMHGTPHKLIDYWRRFYQSTRHHMSNGAEHIHRLITKGHGDQWRGSREKKK